MWNLKIFRNIGEWGKGKYGQVCGGSAKVSKFRFTRNVDGHRNIKKVLCQSFYFFVAPVFSRVPFSFHGCFFRLLSWAGFIFHGCDFLIIFHRQKIIFTPAFLTIFINFYGYFFYFAAKIGKYWKFSTGAVFFFTQKKNWTRLTREDLFQAEI